MNPREYTPMSDDRNALARLLSAARYANAKSQIQNGALLNQHMKTKNVFWIIITGDFWIAFRLII